MEEEKINYRLLRKIQEMEKSSSLLTELVSDFYKDLSEYLENLNGRLEKEQTQQKQVLLKEEIQNTKKIAANIYEQREKKILLAAVSKARGGNPDLKNMIDAEKDLYESVLNTMLSSREKYLETETKEESESKTKRVETEEIKEEIEKPKIEEPVKIKETKQKNTNPMIRITQDIPEFIGTDEKKYSLKNNDVLSLPEDMSEMLTKRGVVKKIEEEH